MQKIFCFAVIALFLGFTNPAAMAQSSNGVQLKKGQSFQSTVTVKNESSTMGLNMTNSTSTTSQLTVYDENEKYYWAKDSIRRMKVENDMMGQQSSYDSDSPEKNDEKIQSLIGDVNRQVDTFYIDKGTGTRTSISTKTAAVKKMTVENSLLPTDSENDKVANDLFLIVPNGLKKGDSWKDSVISNAVKNRITYTLESIDEKRATVKVQSVSTVNESSEMDGTAFEMTMQTDMKGTLLVEMGSKLILEKLLESTISGDLMMMGQTIPMNMTSILTFTLTPL